MQDNDKKIALISGANRGLGFEISKQLAHQGIRVIIGARDSIKGTVAADNLKQQGLDAYSCVLDVTDAESICKTVNWILEQFGALHILVNNAGVILDRSTSVLDLNADTLSQTLQPNLIGPFLLCQTCIPLMKKANYGRIVNVSSLLGSLTDISDANSPFSRVMAPAYRMSKTALNALTTLFAKELQGTNILINSAHPGWLQTDMGSKAADLSDAQVIELVFEGERCVGVTYLQNGTTRTVRATCEVILCASAAESPKLLMLSGIGPAKHLEQFSIPVRVNLPGVGENFHDHAYLTVVYDLARAATDSGQIATEALLFLRSSPGWLSPDLELILLPTTFAASGKGHPDGLTIVTALVRPMSRGTVRLASTDPLVPPLLDPNFLGAKSDVQRLMQAVRVSREIFATAPLSGWVKGEIVPGADIQSDADLRDAVRQHTISQWHMAGSAKMGLDEMSVVDPELRVYGVTGLRVVDASIMPSIISGHTQAAIIMIAERASDLIKQTHGLL